MAQGLQYVSAVVVVRVEEGSVAENQRTLAASVEIEGIGLHSGKRIALRILPADSDSGIVFVRLDLGRVEIRASHRNLGASNYSTSIGIGSAVVATVEHLLSALHGLGIDNARIELDGPEVPILDGSARPFVDRIREAGIRSLSRPRRFLTLTRPVRVRSGEREILAIPDNVMKATYAIDFPHPVIGYQMVDTVVDEATYVESIAPARTFCLLRDVEAMRRAGLALGGSLDNALVVGDDGVLNGSLRFPDEFARHKVLDLVGDLALLEAPLRAHIIAFKGGHNLHAALVAQIMASRSTWALGTSDDLLPASRVAEFAHLKHGLLPQPALETR